MHASGEGHVEVVRYLCEVGGKELLMMTDKVSALQRVCIDGHEVGMRTLGLRLAGAWAMLYCGLADTNLGLRANACMQIRVPACGTACLDHITERRQKARIYVYTRTCHSILCTACMYSARARLWSACSTQRYAIQAFCALFGIYTPSFPFMAKNV